MKKIFTLIIVALCAISVNAQGSLHCNRKFNTNFWASRLTDVYKY
jgi:hypothetical protein